MLDDAPCYVCEGKARKEAALQSLLEQKAIRECALRMLLKEKAVREQAHRLLLERKVVRERTLRLLLLHIIMKEHNQHEDFYAMTMKDETLSLYLQSERLRTVRNRAK